MFTTSIQIKVVVQLHNVSHSDQVGNESEKELVGSSIQREIQISKNQLKKVLTVT